jgi:hypothetical protein
MVRRRQTGEEPRQIARSMACSPNTVRNGLGCPDAVSAKVEQKILDARGAADAPGRVVGRHRSTVWNVPKRHCVSRRRRGRRQTFNALNGASLAHC